MCTFLFLYQIGGLIAMCASFYLLSEGWATATYSPFYILTHRVIFSFLNWLIILLLPMLLNGSAILPWGVGFLENRYRKFVKECPPWQHHRLRWRVYMGEFWPSAIRHWQYWLLLYLLLVCYMYSFLLFVKSFVLFYLFTNCCNL